MPRWPACSILWNSCSRKIESSDWLSGGGIKSQNAQRGWGRGNSSGKSQIMSPLELWEYGSHKEAWIANHGKAERMEDSQKWVPSWQFGKHCAAFSSCLCWLLARVCLRACWQKQLRVWSCNLCDNIFWNVGCICTRKSFKGIFFFIGCSLFWSSVITIMHFSKIETLLTNTHPHE